MGNRGGSHGFECHWRHCISIRSDTVSASNETGRPRVVAIVQARMASSRLPGKVMHPIAGKPLLWHVIHRLRRCKTLDHIAVATSTSAHDDPIAAFAHEHGVALARGSEHNVLARYLLAAWQTDAEIIVRVSADAPFVDAAFIDHLVETLIAKGGDYVVLEPGAQCAHEGVDPFTRRALEKLAREAARDSVAREHVTGYFKLNPGFVDVVHAPGVAALAKDMPRLTVDTPDDVAFAEAVHARLAANAGEASLEDLLWLIEREPGLKTINAHVRQKSLRHGDRALVFCDGGVAAGFGRVRQAAMIAKNLRDRECFGVTVALYGDDAAAKLLRASGIDTAILSPRDPGGAFLDFVEDRRPGIVVCAARAGIDRTTLAKIGERVPVVAVIDDMSERRLAATHAYYPPTGEAEALAWTDSHTAASIGWHWPVIGFDPAAHAQDRTLGEQTEGARLRVVVSMGGSDRNDQTRLAARALAKISAPFHARFIIGPGCDDADAVAHEIETFAPNFSAVRNGDVAAEFAAADLALASFGVTAYELAALGVPALYLGVDQPHLEAARGFQDLGAGVVLGLGRAPDEETIARSVLDLMRQSDRRAAMREAGRTTIDGRGAERIAAELARAFQEAQSRVQVAS